jgi:hypothetical protein
LAGRYDLVVAKYDASGNRLWLTQRGTDEREFAEGVATDAAGNIYVTGSTGHDLDGNSNAGAAGSLDIFLMKFDAAGNWQWTKQDGTGQDDDSHAVAVDSAGNIYITGYVRGNFHGITRVALADIFISKYDPSGNRLWSALFGSSDVDEGCSITCDASNNVYVAGYAQESVEGNPFVGVADNILAKYDSAGNRQWLRQWGTANNQSAYAVKADGSGNVYVAGYTTGVLYGPKYGGRDIFLAKYDSAGSFIWGIQRGSTESDQVNGVATDAAGNIYITGQAGASLDGNPYVGNDDMFLAKYNSAGTEIWTKEMGGAGNDVAVGVSVFTNGSIFVCGYTGGDFDGNINQGIEDMFLLKFAPSNSPPPIPTARPATAVTTSGFTANWLTSSWAAGYRLEVATNSSFGTFLAGYQNLDVGNVLSRSLTGLNPASSYYYRVRAYNTNGTSTNSVTIAAATVSAGCNPAILLNGSFEGASAGGIATNWIAYQHAGSPAPYSIWSIQTAAPPPGGGSQYQQIANTNSTGGGGVRQDVGGTAIGATYVVAGWYRGNSLQATCRVKVSPTASTNFSTAIDLNPPQVVSTNNWVAFSGTVVATGTNMTIWLDGQTGGTLQFKAECFDAVTVTCLGPATPLYFSSVSALPPNQVALVLTGAAGAGVSIQRSSNLFNWQPWTNLLNGSGTLQLLDTPPAGLAPRFYRATSP